MNSVRGTDLSINNLTSLCEQVTFTHNSTFFRFLGVRLTRSLQYFAIFCIFNDAVQMLTCWLRREPGPGAVRPLYTYNYQNTHRIQLVFYISN